MHGDGPLLVLAGAGSGKTRVLTHRIAWLVDTGGPRPRRSSRSPSPTRPPPRCASASSCWSAAARAAMWVMTFHSACARMLRADAERLGYTRGFTIYDEADSLRLVKQLHGRARRRPQALPAARRSSARSPTPRTSCSTPRPTARRSARSSSRPPPTSTSSTSSALHATNAMDFDDLLFRCVNLLELFPEVRERYRQRLPPRAGRRVPGHQPRPVPAGCSCSPREHRNLCVVGDDDQSIYGFRGADIRNILDFEDDFPDADVVKLEQNYRSTQTILDAANAVDRATTAARKAKTLWTDLGEGDPVHVRELEDEHAEARFVGRRDRAAGATRAARATRSRSSTGPTRSQPRARGHAGALRASPTR